MAGRKTSRKEHRKLQKRLIINGRPTGWRPKLDRKRAK